MKTHSIVLGYVTWIFGFTGSHRFYFGKPISGTIWMCTFGVFGIGWLLDLFFIPGMYERANTTYKTGKYNYSLSWIFLTFLGVFGVHRFYLGKWLTAILYLCTGGLVFFGVLYDYWNLNKTVSDLNSNEK